MPRKDDLELRELFSQPYVPRCVPLEHIPLHIEVDGIRVESEIVKLWPADMTVQLGDRRTGLHVPHFAMGPVCRLATDDGTNTLAITPRGQQRAESLLRELWDARQASMGIEPKHDPARHPDPLHDRDAVYDQRLMEPFDTRRDDRQTLMQLGFAHVELGNYEEGAAASLAALQDDPDMKVAQSNVGLNATNNLGVCLTNLGRYEEAVECLERNVRLFAPTYFNLGLALFRLHRYGDALPLFVTAAGIDPPDAEYFDMLGNTFSELGQNAEARAALERAIEVDPEYALAHHDLGVVLALEGEASDALRSFETAIGLDPNLFWAYYSIGCIHARAGRSDLALKFLEQALEKGLRDFEHIEKDPDLDSLRQETEFRELLARYARQ